jgi:hypothetical protein
MKGAQAPAAMSAAVAKAFVFMSSLPCRQVADDCRIGFGATFRQISLISNSIAPRAGLFEPAAVCSRQRRKEYCGILKL